MATASNTIQLGNPAVTDVNTSGSIHSSGNIVAESNGLVYANDAQNNKWIGFDTRIGALPTYPTSYYPVLKTTHQNLYISVNGSYSAYMTSGGTLNSVSDKTKKENYEVLDKQDVLIRLNKLNVERWNFISEEDNVKRIGPYAQEFHKQFGLGGDDDKMIATYDMAGISIVGIQALTELVKLQEKELKKQQIQIEKLMKMIEKRIINN